MDKGSSSSSLHGSSRTAVGQNQANPSASLRQGFHGWGPNLSGPFPYGHPPVRGFTLPPEHRLTPENSRRARIHARPSLPPPPNPMAAYPIWQQYTGIGVLAPVLPPPLQPLPPPPCHVNPYPIWQQDPLVSGVGLPPPPPPPLPPYPTRAYPTWQPEPLQAEIGVLLPPPLPPYPMRAYPTWQPEPVQAEIGVLLQPPYPMGTYPTWRPDLHWCTLPQPELPPYPMTACPTWQHDPTAVSG
ncbi:hypothetical protein L6164_013203 [Bauhinia variegata]|uniref:Uncharacterized protein n=1 Tax=Bauhinia variegata TaxID=167791 RepID=A0ACB9PCB4_BAUVA|nr:hypothetical protein L6164_013203 [Bauhinia variegata]